MFCAFAGPPKIIRLHRRGTATPVTEPGLMDRDLLLTSHSRRTAEGLVTYRATRNAASIDGLPVF